MDSIFVTGGIQQVKLRINTKSKCCKTQMTSCKLSKVGREKIIKQKRKERQIENEILLSSDEAHGLRRPQHKMIPKGNFKTLGGDPQARGLMTADAYEEQWSYFTKSVLGRAHQCRGNALWQSVETVHLRRFPSVRL